MGPFLHSGKKKCKSKITAMLAHGVWFFLHCDRHGVSTFYPKVSISPINPTSLETPMALTVPGFSATSGWLGVSGLHSKSSGY